MTELLPCPFCASTDVDPEGWRSKGGEVGPECYDCGATAQTVEIWNTRPSPWLDIATAPLGGGAELVSDQKWVEPPMILLRFEDNVAIGRWDWYYAEGGAGCVDGIAWVEPCSGERLTLHYGEPSYWMPIPDGPKED